MGLDHGEQSLSGWVLRIKTLCEFLKSWVNLGPPMIMPIGLISYPAAYLHGILQTHASETQVLVSSLEFSCEVLSIKADQVQVESKQGTEKVPQEVDETNAGLEPPPYGCYISGLVLQGVQCK